MYKPSACLLLFLAALVLAAPRSDFSDDRTAQRLWQDTRQTMQEQEQKVREYRLDIPSENIGQTAETDPETDPEADQGEALFNAVNHSDWQTVRPLLERYTQQTEYDPDIALLPAPRSPAAKADRKPPNKNTKPCCNAIPTSHADGLITHACFLKAVWTAKPLPNLCAFKTKTCPKPSKKTSVIFATH